MHHFATKGGLVVIESRESERSYICVFGVSIFPLSTILIFDFGIIPTVFFLSLFDFIRSISYYFCVLRVMIFNQQILLP